MIFILNPFNNLYELYYEIRKFDFIIVFLRLSIIISILFKNSRTMGQSQTSTNNQLKRI